MIIGFTEKGIICYAKVETHFEVKKNEKSNNNQTDRLIDQPKEVVLVALPRDVRGQSCPEEEKEEEEDRLQAKKAT